MLTEGQGSHSVAEHSLSLCKALGSIVGTDTHTQMHFAFYSEIIFIIWLPVGMLQEFIGHYKTYVIENRPQF